MPRLKTFAPLTRALPKPKRRVPTWLLVTILSVLLLLGLAAMITLAVKFENLQEQNKLEQEINEVASYIKNEFLKDVQNVQLIGNLDSESIDPVPNFRLRTLNMLAQHPEMMRMQLWGGNGELISNVLSNMAPPNFGVNLPRSAQLPFDSQTAFNAAVNSKLPQFSLPYFSPLPEGGGLEVIDVWVPLLREGNVQRLTRTTYSFVGILNELYRLKFVQEHDIAITMLDGMHLARRKYGGNGGAEYAAQTLIELPNVPLQLKATKQLNIGRFFPSIQTTLIILLGASFVVTFLFLAFDVRRRYRAERRIRGQANLRAAMEDALVTGLRARDLEGRVTYVNPAFCAMVGFSKTELEGALPPMPYWAPEGLREYETRAAQRLSGQLTREGFETIFMRKNGERFPVLIFEAPLRDADGRQIGWMSSILDLTEQRQAEAMVRLQYEQLAAQARLATMGELSSSLSHELNQPLAAISSYATAANNMLTQGDLPPQELQTVLTKIVNQAQRAAKVIKSVHNFVRRKDAVKERLDCRRLIDGIMPLLQLQAQQQGVKLDLKLAQFVPDVLADRVMLEQVLLNITRNGIDAMKDTPRSERQLKIEVRHAQHDDLTHAFLSITDAGPGIAPELAEEIYSPYFSTKDHGMGMGLAICRSVVEQSGGKLWHSARADGQRGCVFNIELPAAHETED